MYRSHLATAIAIVLFAMACTRNNVDTFSGFVKPAHFPEPAYDLGANPITRDGFELEESYSMTPFYPQIQRSVVEAAIFPLHRLHITVIP